MRLSLLLMILGVVILAASVESEQQKKGWWSKFKNKVKNVVNKGKSFFENVFGKAKNCLKSCKECPNSQKPLNVCKKQCFKSESSCFANARRSPRTPRANARARTRILIHLFPCYRTGTRQDGRLQEVPQECNQTGQVRVLLQQVHLLTPSVAPPVEVTGFLFYLLPPPSRPPPPPFPPPRPPLPFPYNQKPVFRLFHKFCFNH